MTFPFVIAAEMATLNDLGKQLDDITERMIEQEEDSRAEEEVISSFVKVGFLQLLWAYRTHSIDVKKQMG